MQLCGVAYRTSEGKTVDDYLAEIDLLKQEAEMHRCEAAFARNLLALYFIFGLVPGMLLSLWTDSGSYLLYSVGISGWLAALGIIWTRSRSI